MAQIPMPPRETAAAARFSRRAFPVVWMRIRSTAVSATNAPTTEMKYDSATKLTS